MGTITLELPVADTEVTAGLHAANYADIQAVINGGLDSNNWAAGKIFAPSKITQEGATSGQVLGWNGSQWAPATVGTVTLYSKTTTKDVVNTVTETDLLNGEITLAANILGANGYADIIATGDYLNNSGAGRTFQLKLKLGTTTIWDSGASSATNAGANRRGWTFRARLWNENSASAQTLAGLFVMGSAAAATTGWGAIEGAGTSVFGSGLGGTGTLDTTSSKLLELTVIHSTNNANLSMRLQKAHIVVTTKA